MRTRSRAKNRRGVLLLLLLGLLAMFGVVAITFVLITGQYRRAASLGRTGESPLEEEQELLDNAFKQLVRGDKKSIMGCLSLLEDMYGNRTFGAPDAAGNATPQGMIVNKPNTTFVRLVAPGTVAGRSRGQILEFTAAMVDPTNPQNTAYMPDPYRYVGQVLTFLDGPARHQSVPIIGYRIDSINNQAVLQTVAPDVSPEDLMENYFYRGARCRYIINGSAFSGTGFGLKTLSAGAPDPVPDTQDGLLEATTYPNSIATANASLSPFYPEIALMPNAPEGREPAGGANEDYDAADLQNPHLATILRDGTVPSPSFHRPEIVRYWLNRIKTVAAEDPSDPNQFAVLAQKYLSAPADKLACRIIFRPLPKYHPNFTGSNPAFQLALGHYASGFNPLWSGIRLEQDANSNGTVEPAEYRWDWDVDSDGDGTPDSIWVDLGMPVRSDADGRLYKPLFAIFCTDLDGRLNVNAHGAHMHRDPSFTSVVDPNNPAFAPPGMMSMGGMFAFAGGAPLALPRGLGYAPFEISLAPLFSSPLDYQAVIANRYYSVIPATGTPEYLPGTANADDFLSWNMWSQYGGAYWNMTAAGNAGSYGSPPDFDGDMVVGLDPGGRPIYSRAAIGDHVDDPGELDLAGSASVDSPYTPAELEPILRPYDTDSASLISRLLPPTLTASSNLVAYRNLLTTDSWDVPVPNLSVPEDIVRRLIAEINGTGATAPVPAVKTWLISLYPPRHMSDVLALKAYFEYRVRDTSGGGLAARQTNAMTHARQIAAAASQVLSWDLMTGLKMDINRPFGNGQDQAIDLDLPPDGIPDTINNVVDEPGRIIRNTSSPYALKLDTGFMGPPRFFGFPGESADGTETTLLRDRTGALIPNIGFNHVDGFDVNGDGTVDQIDKALVRQWYARHLYVLMMLLADERAFYGTNKTDPTDPQDGFRVYSQAEDERKARTIAQWAINVVDFRDRDSIMTPFEYDIYPFTNPVVNMSGTPPVFDNNGPNNTWDVDGIIEANPNNPDLLPPSGTAPYIDDGQPYRGLVWGCERPELLITETLATHDFRLQDLDTDNGDAKKTTDTPNPDDDYDNLKRPEGSLFIELYNPWTNLEPAPAELYSSLTGGGVDLARVVPDRPDPNQPGLAVNWPVWRMIFVPGDNTMAALDPDDPENWPRNGGTLVAERSLYFTNPTGAISLTVPPQETAKPLTGADANHGTEQFYPDVPVGVIPPGGYAVIGPGLPQAAVSGSGTDYVTYFGKRSSDPGDPQTQEPTDANQTRQIRLNVGGANPAESPVKANTNPQLEPQTGQIRNVVSIVVNEPNRLNLTEPDGGYPDTIPGATFDSNSTRMYLTAVPGGSPMASDTPLDAGRTDRIGAYLNPADPPTVQARVSIAHLQRLANPLQPWHPELNPYLTVDSSPIDLIPFNGWANMPSGQPNPKHFASHQRGETNTSDDGTNNLWIQRLGLKAIDSTPNQLGDGHYFDEILSHSLGYVSSRLPLNDPAPFGPPRTTPPYLGDPAGGPFPWLAWNNRPFVSQLELLSVPVASSSRLLNANIGAGTPEPNYTFFAMVEPNLGNYSPYDGIAMSPTQEGGFAHQLNFFHSRAYPTGPGAGMPEFHRVLDYTFVPSRFVGNTLAGNPNAFSMGSHVFYPPFNSISYYREPGRINLNTLSDPLVWEGLTNGSPIVSNNLAQAFTWFTDNRRGFALGAHGVDINNQFPTRMTRPFRTFAGRYLVPETQVTPNLQAQVGREVGSGMLREHPTVANHPLFEEANLGGAATNSQRNPFFQYRGLQRLGNLATSRSNVYAIWITLGKFEVQPIAYRPTDSSSKTYQLTPAEFSLIYGDGYELGQELGSDIGRVERHRSFYIFDRSIPMGFVRGEDLNIEKGIRLKRSIK